MWKDGEKRKDGRQIKNWKTSKVSREKDGRTRREVKEIRNGVRVMEKEKKIPTQRKERENERKKERWQPAAFPSR